MTEFGWSADPSASTYAADAKLQAANVPTTYATLQSIPYVVRGHHLTSAATTPG